MGTPTGEPAPATEPDAKELRQSMDAQLAIPKLVSQFALEEAYTDGPTLALRIDDAFANPGCGKANP